MITRIMMAAVMAGLLMVATAGAALAGEVTGNGTSTPIREYIPASICSFSGLNDTYSGDPDVPDEDGFTRTQNWGQVDKEFRKLIRAGLVPEPPPPNIACNPSHGGAEH